MVRLTAKETSAANDSLRIKTLPQKIVANKTLILMCLPAIIFFLVFSYMPMPGAYVAFTRFDYGKGIFASQFIGLRNFQFLFKSGQLALLLKNTVLYNLAFIILGNMLQLTFAVMLNEVQSRRYKKTTQSMMFLPYFISPVLVSLIVYNMINYDFGFLSSLIRASGGVMPKLYSTASAWPFIIILVHLWQSTGYGTVIYFAAITSIDESLFEAAKVDGANGFQRIRYITLPSLRPTVVILFLFAIGRLVVDRPPLFAKGVTDHADPLPQALVLTAIVISFALTALFLVVLLAARGLTGTDHVDGQEPPE